jgi:hypothetical protein
MITSQLAIVYLPAGQLLFDTEAIGLMSWLRIAAAGVIVHLLVALEMAWRRSRANAAALEATATTTPIDHTAGGPHGR